MTCTQQQADLWLQSDLVEAEHCVNSHVHTFLTQHEFDALVDFVVNLGCGAFATSTLLKLLNAGDYHGAAAQFERWQYVAGKQCAGLLRRRKAEEAD
jgi:lysozyme